jgi:Tol biopolymer transport system component/DNA-binding winged helix-turn-helix (wHTH) protein
MASLAGPKLKRYCFDDVVVEPDCYRVLRDGEPQDLQPRAFDLLIYLIGHRDRVVDKQELFDFVWHGEAVSDNALTRAVKEIRRATGDDAAHPRHIETVQRRGYRFIASLNHDVPLESVIPGVPLRARRPFPWARAKRAALCVLAVLPLFVLAAHLWLTHGDTRVDLSGVRLFPFSTEYIEYGSPRWSPNGRTIAFCARNEGTIRLFVQSLDAPVPLCLTPQSMLAKYPFWGPDSREVYFIRFLNNRAGSMRNGSLWKVSTAGGEPALVQPEAHYATISPDGRTVASLRMTQQPRSFRLWTANPPRASPQPYEPAPFQGKFYENIPNVQFAPNGKKILIAANPDSTGEQVWLVPWPPGPGRRILQDFPGYGGTPQFSWMPDSRHVVVMQRTDRRQPFQILLADTVTNKWWPIHASERNAAWPDASPDGTNVAFVSDLSNIDVVEVPVDGSAPRTLTASARHESMPTYSPDGRTIVYVADRRGFDELWAQNLQDGRSWSVLTPSDFQSRGWAAVPIHHARLLSRRPEDRSYLRE